MELELRYLRTHYEIDAIVDVRETGRRGRRDSLEYHVRLTGFAEDVHDLTWERRSHIVLPQLSQTELARRQGMLHDAETCRAGTAHEGRRPCVVPYGAGATMAAAAGAAAWRGRRSCGRRQATLRATRKGFGWRTNRDTAHSGAMHLRPSVCLVQPGSQLQCARAVPCALSVLRVAASSRHRDSQPGFYRNAKEHARLR